MKGSNPMDIITRSMEVKDLDQIMVIELESFTTPWTKESFRVEIQENGLAQYFIAEIDGKVVGYGGIWLILDEGHITNVAVGKEYRGLGVGNKLVEALILYCKEKNITNMTLEVRESNLVAQNLYKKYGFLEYGIRPNYYADDHEDAVIMWKVVEEGDNFVNTSNRNIL
jgi:ribosomal-protein-alanine N-acetyltransferase